MKLDADLLLAVVVWRQSELCGVECGEGHVTTPGGHVTPASYQSVKSLSCQLAAAIAHESTTDH